ncbi:SoxR reducing system RseC family protein [Silvimonas iriomotensis]|uniref:SoxR reducing system protein RseC n=1 Tax=Silvimonas iriomotensis TaxID=449662 RepID=A0ABQ2P706_9NEIS|nr:SoxR reducing system RseC family protein [Silvimonas iriomotensis]GGP19836.1 SoxR reducing system protein RseC [Silvimonas iriomotensis]
MIESEAQVVRREGEHVWVRIRPHAPCGNCDPETGCKSVAITRMFGNAKEAFRVRNTVDAQPGDFVRIGVADGMLLRTAFAAYGVPLIALMAGAVLGRTIAPFGLPDLGAVLGAATGFVAGFLILRSRRNLASQAEPATLERLVPGAQPIKFCDRNTPSPGGAH